MPDRRATPTPETIAETVELDHSAIGVLRDRMTTLERRLSNLEKESAKQTEILLSIEANVAWLVGVV